MRFVRGGRAIEVLLSKVAVSEDAREKFLGEISLMKDLRHRHIIALLDYGSAGSAFYLVMELCEGGSAGELMAPTAVSRCRRLTAWHTRTGMAFPS